MFITHLLFHIHGKEKIAVEIASKFARVNEPKDSTKKYRSILHACIMTKYMITSNVKIAFFVSVSDYLSTYTYNYANKSSKKIPFSDLFDRPLNFDVLTVSSVFR